MVGPDQLLRPGACRRARAAHRGSRPSPRRRARTGVPAVLPRAARVRARHRARTCSTPTATTTSTRTTTSPRSGTRTRAWSPRSPSRRHGSTRTPATSPSRRSRTPSSCSRTFRFDAHVMFTCTGSEANDLALRVAKAATGGEGVIVTWNAYHGVTTEVAGISPSLVGVDGMRALGARGAGTRRGPDVSIAEAVAATLSELEAFGVKPGGARRRHDLRQRRRLPARRRPGRCGRARAQGGRSVHRRRGAARVRASRRRDVGLRPARARARHRHHGQADGQRASDRGDGRAARGAGAVRRGHAVLQHVRRQPGRRSPPRRRRSTC